MLFARVEQLFHRFLSMLRNALKTGVFEPVLGSVFSERKFPQGVSINVFTQVE